MSIPPLSGKDSLYPYSPLNFLSIPQKIWNSVRGFFEAPKKVVVYVEEKDLDDSASLLIKTYPTVFDMLDEATKPYKTILLKIEDGTELRVATTFLSDIERTGEPDQFFIDDQLIAPPPKTQEQKLAVLKKMYEISDKNGEKLTHWTQIWNYRLKISLAHHLSELFFKKYGLFPVFKRESFKEANLRLDSQSGELKCELKGRIESATDEEANIVSSKVAYTAFLSCSEINDRIDIEINFTES